MPRPWKETALPVVHNNRESNERPPPGPAASPRGLITQPGISHPSFPPAPAWYPRPSLCRLWLGLCVPTAAEWMGLLMSSDTNGAVRRCDYGSCPHAAQPWQEMTRDSAPFHPPVDSAETIFSRQLERYPPQPRPPPV